MPGSPGISQEPRFALPGNPGPKRQRQGDNRQGNQAHLQYSLCLDPLDELEPDEGIEHRKRVPDQENVKDRSSIRSFRLFVAIVHPSLPLAGHLEDQPQADHRTESDLEKSHIEHSFNSGECVPLPHRGPDLRFVGAVWDNAIPQRLHNALDENCLSKNRETVTDYWRVPHHCWCNFLTPTTPTSNCALRRIRSPGTRRIVANTVGDVNQIVPPVCAVVRICYSYNRFCTVSRALLQHPCPVNAILIHLQQSQNRDEIVTRTSLARNIRAGRHGLRRI